MLLLLFYGTSTGPVTTPSGHPGFSRARGRNFLINDDDAALQMLLDAEQDDILTAVERYDSALRKLL